MQIYRQTKARKIGQQFTLSPILKTHAESGITMDWMESIREAICYMEENMTQALTIERVANKVHISPFYFQKGFAMLCGFTVGEYIRNRRLALAGSEVISTNKKIIDIALAYGYESPDSFAKAFVRFHGATPSAVRKEGAMIRTFAPLKIKFTLEGGCSMEYKIVKKDAFTVIGAQKEFQYETAKQDIPLFWTKHYEDGNGKVVCGMYGLNFDENMGGDTFTYLIADNYNPVMDVPKGFITKRIPQFTWAVFACTGPMPNKLQEVNQQVFSEWLPGCKQYEIAAGYCIEMYDDPANYKKGAQDEAYYCEMWIPVKEK